MKAVIVLELDLPEDDLGVALADSVAAVRDADVPYLVPTLRASIKGDAERVLAVFEEEK